MLPNSAPETIVATLLAFVVAITIHEFSHAWSALMLGDDTAARQGRVTLNPLSHLDPLGSLGILFLLFVGFGIGWGRPVPISASRLRYRQRGVGLTALAGPLSNIILAVLFVLPLHVGGVGPDTPGYVFFYMMVWVNVLLASFNLIPIPPLDGHKILTGVLPNFWYPYLAPLEQYGVFILLALIMFGRFTGNILGEMYGPVFRSLSSLVGLTGLPI